MTTSTTYAWRALNASTRLAGEATRYTLAPTSGCPEFYFRRQPSGGFRRFLREQHANGAVVRA